MNEVKYNIGESYVSRKQTQRPSSQGQSSLHLQCLLDHGINGKNEDSKSIAMVDTVSEVPFGSHLMA